MKKRKGGRERGKGEENKAAKVEQLGQLSCLGRMFARVFQMRVNAYVCSAANLWRRRHGRCAFGINAYTAAAHYGLERIS